MFIDLRGIHALRQLRIDHQESLGLDFPEGCQTEMLFLYDVCKSLGLTLFQAQEVLGAPAYQMVTNLINRPAGYLTQRGREMLVARQTS
ncbi:MAG: hypothetical protein U0X20_12180 [Caldilineaceae bacterium]